jgi:uncharacterized protein (DUF1810 family)
VDTERFITAQNPIIDDALLELGAGRKQSRWMWFIFPQLKALGRSAMAQHYGLEGLQDARDWMAHTVLSARLIDCTQALFKHPSKSIESIMGSPDDLKLRSCMTLLKRADPVQPLFGQVIEIFYRNEPDPQTLALLEHVG